MNIVNIILAVTCIILAITQIVHAKWIGQLMADNEVHKSALSTCGKRLNAQNAAIKELTGWNSELSERLNNARNRDAEILQNLRDAVTNQIKTDKRVTEIERYYVTYVARKKVEDDGDQIQEKPVSDE